MLQQNHETQSWMCRNVIVGEFTFAGRENKKLTGDWSMFDGILHHDTCDKIDGDKVKGAWSFPSIMTHCACCGAEIPEPILMIAKLQMLKPEKEYRI